MKKAEIHDASRGRKVTLRTIEAPSYLRARLTALVAMAGAAVCLSGCESDSYMDPSVIGRWEHTPTTVPILDRLASIEGPDDELVEHTHPTADDLIPVVDQYRIGPGDSLLVVVWDIPVQRQATPYEVLVDSRGIIEIPEVGSITAAGRTAEQVRDAVANAMRERELVANPLVSVTVRSARQRAFTVIGAVSSPGPYLVPTADFRLLEALATAGGFSEVARNVFVIRQVPLSEDVSGAIPQAPEPVGRRTVPAAEGDDLLNLIEDLTRPAPPNGGGSPGVLGTGERATSRWQPGTNDGPPVGLVEPAPGRPAQPGAPRASDEPTWVFIDGEWVPVRREGRAGAAASGETPLVTQRVIKIPVKDLVAGDARYNIVIRPGDVVRVPPPPTGFIFMEGQIGRAGAFNLNSDITLLRAVASSGGLGSLAVPQRVDLTRMVGDDRQATIRLNLKAIKEGTQPDIYLKSNDLINVGTTFWAFPLAVARNGFRMTYGFGFLLDRNFGNDVFGAPPVNRFGQ